MRIDEIERTDEILPAVAGLAARAVAGLAKTVVKKGAQAVGRAAAGVASGAATVARTVGKTAGKVLVGRKRNQVIR